MDNWYMKFTSKYDYEALKTFNKYNLYSRPTTWIITILSVLLIVIGIIFTSFDTYYRLILCCIGIAWILEVIFLPHIHAKSTIRTSKINNMSTVEVKMDSNNISMITKKEDNVVSTGSIEYDDVYKICDTKEYIYVYIAKNQAILCSKQNMDGNYEDCKKFLVEKLGKKYIVK